MKSGTTEACWKDYSKKLPSSTKNVVKYREDLIEFLNVGAHTVRKYMNGDTIQGLPLIKMRVFLTLKGYEILELKKLSPVHLKLVELVAFDVITLDEIVKEIGYATTSGALRLLRGDTLLRGRDQQDKERWEKVEGWIQEYGPDLNAAKELWMERLGTNKIVSVPQHTEIEAPALVTPKISRRETTANNDEAIFIGLAKALEPVAARILEESTPEDRKRLRDKVGNQEIFELSTSLNRFCSETAFAQFTGRNRDKQTNQH